MAGTEKSVELISEQTAVVIKKDIWERLKVEKDRLFSEADSTTSLYKKGLISYEQYSSKTENLLGRIYGIDFAMRTALTVINDKSL